MLGTINPSESRGTNLDVKTAKLEPKIPLNVVATMPETANMFVITVSKLESEFAKRSSKICYLRYVGLLRNQENLQ